MKIYNYTFNGGFYIGESEADEDPKIPGNFLIPACATTIKPPSVDAPDCAVFDGAEWVIVSPPTPEEEPEDHTMLIPTTISPRQGEIVLYRHGLLAAVLEYFDGLEGQAGEEARIDFKRAQEWRRDWQTLNDAATSFGLTSEQIDQMFIEAAAVI